MTIAFIVMADAVLILGKLREIINTEVRARPPKRERTFGCFKVIQKGRYERRYRAVLSQSDTTRMEAPSQRNDGATADGRPPYYKRTTPRIGND
jgi:hypothetical protein